MRLGLISDIHANLHALEAVLDALRKERVEQYLCAGDLVGYGPLPNECVERVAGLDSLTVAGNHDLIALGTLPGERCIPLAQRSLAWTREVLREETRRYLGALPLAAEMEGVVLAHGSLDDPEEYIREPSQVVRQLGRMEARYPDAGVLVLGHTHRARAHSGDGAELPRDGTVPIGAGGARLLNPGSVGQSRERSAVARYAVLDLESRTARLHAVPYDVQACREALRRAGLSPHSCHLAPSRFRIGLSAARSLFLPAWQRRNAPGR